jgi:glyoxylase-like metal-dependent hydrolase (beta-lactamase superfamily II)
MSSATVAYIAEIRKITQAPIKYVIYSHHHYDHIAGGKPFKDAGATFIAHRNAQAHLSRLKDPDVVLPDRVVDERSTIELGGTRLDLLYVGRNHSDNSLVMYLPKEKIIFAVDFLWLGTIAFRDLPDGFIPDWFDSLDRVLALDWERMIPGHPGPGGRLGMNPHTVPVTATASARRAARRESDGGGDARGRREVVSTRVKASFGNSTMSSRL